MISAIVIYAPAGHGKTHWLETVGARKVLRHFGMRKVRDGDVADPDWIFDGDVILTNKRPGELPSGVRLLTLQEARTELETSDA